MNEIASLTGSAVAMTVPELADKTAMLDTTLSDVIFGINNLWVILCFVLIFFMQPGFAFLESGLLRSTNVINVLFKNLIDICVGAIAFFAIGYSLMFNPASGLDFVGAVSPGWMYSADAGKEVAPAVHFLFQLAFAATAATICSGAVAGRIKLQGYIIASFVIFAVIYPISGYWAWSDAGWLAQKGFHDFAGSTVVHCVGGFAGLAGAIVLGPRLGRLDKGDLDYLHAAEYADYRQSENRPHNLAFSTLGVFLIWIGWFGFNGGSGLQIVDSQGQFVPAVARILFNTVMAACAGGLTATLGSVALNYFSDRHSEDGSHAPLQFDLEFALNGIIAGLVGITAGCDVLLDPYMVVMLGAVCGLVSLGVVVMLSSTMKQLRIDDPVGAFAAHGVCGIIGTVVIGGTYAAQTGEGGYLTQAIGTVAISAWAFMTAWLTFKLLGSVGWLRVSAKEETYGLDLTHHGKAGYRFRDGNLRNTMEMVLTSRAPRQVISEFEFHRKTAVRLSASGRFRGYESGFMKWVSEDLYLLFRDRVNNEGANKQVLDLHRRAEDLLRNRNDELFEQAYSLLCKALEIAFQRASLEIDSENRRMLSRAFPPNATHRQKQKIINDLLARGGKQTPEQSSQTRATDGD